MRNLTIFRAARLESGNIVCAAFDRDAHADNELPREVWFSIFTPDGNGKIIGEHGNFVDAITAFGSGDSFAFLDYSGKLFRGPDDGAGLALRSLTPVSWTGVCARGDDMFISGFNGHALLVRPDGQELLSTAFVDVEPLKGPLFSPQRYTRRARRLILYGCAATPEGEALFVGKDGAALLWDRGQCRKLDLPLSADLTACVFDPARGAFLTCGVGPEGVVCEIGLDGVGRILARAGGRRHLVSLGVWGGGIHACSADQEAWLLTMRGDRLVAVDDVDQRAAGQGVAVLPGAENLIVVGEKGFLRLDSEGWREIELNLS